MTDPTPSPIEDEVEAFRLELDGIDTLQPAILIDNVLTLGREIRDAESHEVAIDAIHRFARTQEFEYAVPVIAEAISVYATTTILLAPTASVAAHLARLQAVALDLRNWHVEWPLMVHTERGF